MSDKKYKINHVTSITISISFVSLLLQISIIIETSHPVTEKAQYLWENLYSFTRYFNLSIVFIEDSARSSFYRENEMDCTV